MSMEGGREFGSYISNTSPKEIVVGKLEDYPKAFFPVCIDAINGWQEPEGVAAIHDVIAAQGAPVVRDGEIARLLMLDGVDPEARGVLQEHIDNGRCTMGDVHRVFCDLAVLGLF